MTEMSHTSPRRTTREAIVAAALALLDEVGIDGLTMRKLARAVGVPPMSLYLHFPSKEKLLDLMYQEIASRLYADLNDESPWQSGLGVLCQRTRTMFLAHPEWVRLLTRPAVPAAVPLRERLLEQMLAAGIPAKDALGCIVSANFVALGLALGQLAFRDNLRTLIERSSDSPHSSSPSEELRFAHATQSLIAGLEARLLPQARAT